MRRACSAGAGGGAPEEGLDMVCNRSAKGDGRSAPDVMRDEEY